MKTSTVSCLLAALSLSLAACGGGSATSDTQESPTPAPSPNPTSTPNGATTCRDFHIESGTDGSGSTNSVYYVSPLGSGTDASEFFGAGGWNAPTALHLCAADPVANKAAVTLGSDVTVAVSLPQSNCVCRKYLASGSQGSFYTGAHADKVDVISSLDSHGSSAGSAPVVTDGAASAQAGDLRISFSVKEAQISASASACTASACDAAVAVSTPHDLVYTTGVATSQVTNPKQGGTVSLTVSGTRFGADFADTSVTGGLAGAGEQQEDNPDANGDVATVERIAE